MWGTVNAEARNEPIPISAGAAGAPSGAAMDRVIKRRSPWIRRGIVLGALAAAGVIAFLVLRPDSQRSLSVAGSHVTTGPVIRGQFDDIIAVRGRVTPLRTTYVDTASGGQVDQI